MTTEARPGESPPGLAEAALFQQVVAGDRNAFRQLYQLHHVPVYWAAFSVLQSRPDAEEIAVDAFMTLWTKRDGIDLVGESTLPWLVTTARFLAKNRMRAVQRRPTVPLETSADLEADAPSPEDLSISREAMRGLEAMIAAMPEEDRDIFRLCLVEDLTYKEAAARLGLSHGSVRNRLSRMKQRLRTELTLLKRGH
ncbi:RNA polymerase sigma factor [Leifsonia poae]|uniref:RNA polymerase sigma factor n=1 Tax=Leifsonia poae TaxID=110933 RepID=UPI001CBBD1F2|nr:sigma-70 family RNA polymerase sigma factor [Leifsonia poae]